MATALSLIKQLSAAAAALTLLPQPLQAALGVAALACPQPLEARLLAPLVHLARALRVAMALVRQVEFAVLAVAAVLAQLVVTEQRLKEDPAAMALHPRLRAYLLRMVAVVVAVCSATLPLHTQEAWAAAAQVLVTWLRLLPELMGWAAAAAADRSRHHRRTTSRPERKVALGLSS